MQIVTDRGCDLSPEQVEGLDIHYVPMSLTLDGVSYKSGEDISPAEFYDLMTRTNSFPTTSQAVIGDFVELYRRLAAKDPDILSIHISSGLSGTLNSARAAAEMVPEANVTFVDTKTLSCPQGWQVEAAALAAKAGWSVERIQELLAEIGRRTEGMFTLDSLKYLIHGGRINHLSGLIASMLRILPVITVDHESGKYVSAGQERTFKKSLAKLVDLVAKIYPNTPTLRIQMLHGKNPDAVEFLRGLLGERFSIQWLPTVAVAPILGAHTGPSLVGLSVGPADLFDNLRKSIG